jgi:hypothetical protein
VRNFRLVKLLPMVGLIASKEGLTCFIKQKQIISYAKLTNNISIRSNKVNIVHKYENLIIA